MAIAIEFKGCNVTFAKNQPEYTPLPAMLLEDGMAVTCWQFSPEELSEIQKTGKIYISQLTFNHPLQPVRAVANLDDLITFIKE